MSTYAALLRSINLGSHNKVAMPALRSVCEGLGWHRVETYIQSGNVVFSCQSEDAAGLQDALETAIASSFGLEVPVIVRSSDRYAQVLSNPYLAEGREPAQLSVGFLREAPEAERVDALLQHPLASPLPGGEGFTAGPQHLYLYHPDGYGRSKLTMAFFERRLGTTMTVRNWRTVLTLAHMMGLETS